jgi:molybdopterin-binding protein
VKILRETSARSGEQEIRSHEHKYSKSFTGTIEKIVSDKVVSEVVIRTEAGIVTSIITTGSVERMNLKEGGNVFAVMKATPVSAETNSRQV